METEQILFESKNASSRIKISKIYDVLYYEEENYNVSKWTCISHKENSNLIKMYYSFDVHVYCFDIHINTDKQIVGCKGSHGEANPVDNSFTQTHMDTLGDIQQHAVHCLQLMFNKNISVQYDENTKNYDYPDCEEWIMS